MHYIYIIFGIKTKSYTILFHRLTDFFLFWMHLLIHVFRYHYCGIIIYDERNINIQFNYIYFLILFFFIPCYYRKYTVTISALIQRPYNLCLFITNFYKNIIIYGADIGCKCAKCYPYRIKMRKFCDTSRYIANVTRLNLTF